MNLPTCPQCGATTVLQGVLDGGGGFPSQFVPDLRRSLSRKNSGIPMNSGNSFACFTCGHLWTTVDPQELRASLLKETGELGRQHAKCLESGPFHDLPDLPQARRAGILVTALDARVLRGDESDAILLFQEVMRVDPAHARTALRGWSDLDRPGKLALCGWPPKRRADGPGGQSAGHPLHDEIVDGYKR